jgi:hypothetical protein
MGAGTRQRLEQLNFPFPHPQVHLILKPNPDLPDLEFKIEAMKEIERLGKVIAVFENEIRTLNRMAEYDSEILLFHRQTLQSPNPPPPHQRIITHTSF